MIPSRWLTLFGLKIESADSTAAAWQSCIFTVMNLTHFFLSAAPSAPDNNVRNLLRFHLREAPADEARSCSLPADEQRGQLHTGESLTAALQRPPRWWREMTWQAPSFFSQCRRRMIWILLYFIISPVLRWIHFHSIYTMVLNKLKQEWH